ncbi:hypothetical protein L596_027455 [Steinernema carpocapsae]|uniref:Uncharacterized protein n=1 Tax=Steinernema carpocapsae TaxID=34508 RepID=A0A4U5LVI4_STECR|nr:hypothetical protein L596_027455 [Steinernema carpocapsae]
MEDREDRLFKAFPEDDDAAEVSNESENSEDDTPLERFYITASRCPRSSRSALNSQFGCTSRWVSSRTRMTERCSSKALFPCKRPECTWLSRSPRLADEDECLPDIVSSVAYIRRVFVSFWAPGHLRPRTLRPGHLRPAKPDIYVPDTNQTCACGQPILARFVAFSKRFKQIIGENNAVRERAAIEMGQIRESLRLFHAEGAHGMSMGSRDGEEGRGSKATDWSACS